jgi:hypothetical protein
MTSCDLMAPASGKQQPIVSAPSLSQHAGPPTRCAEDDRSSVVGDVVAVARSTHGRAPSSSKMRADSLALLSCGVDDGSHARKLASDVRRDVPCGRPVTVSKNASINSTATYGSVPCGLGCGGQPSGRLATDAQMRPHTPHGQPPMNATRRATETRHSPRPISRSARDLREAGRAQMIHYRAHCQLPEIM